MYKIQNMQRLRRLMLSWRHAEDGPTYIVGDVAQDEGSANWIFRYCIGTSDLRSATQKGFSGYPGLPMTDVPILSGVRQIFTTRVPSSQRTDYKVFLNHWHFPDGLTPQTMDVLGYTGGILPRDTFRFVPCFQLGSPFDFVTEVQGTKVFAENIKDLRLGEPVSLQSTSRSLVSSSKYRLIDPRGQQVGGLVTGLDEQVQNWLAVTSVTCTTVRINGSATNPRVVLAVQVAEQT